MLRTLRDFEKCTIGAMDGDIGRVNDAYFDDHDWVVRYLIVDTGSWLSSRHVLISPISIRKPDWPAHQLPVGITRDQIKSSPDIDTAKSVSRRQDIQLLIEDSEPRSWNGPDLWRTDMLPNTMSPGYSPSPVDRAMHEKSIGSTMNAERAEHRGGDPHLRSGQRVIGYNLHTTDGDVGHIEDLLIDDQTWAVRFLVVNTSNWWLGHKVLIAPPWICGVHWLDRTVSVGLSRNAVKDAPPYDASIPLDHQREVSLYAQYGYHPQYREAGATIEDEI